MEMPYFIWNGIKSSDIGIVVNKLPPITIAEERIELKKVAGRNGYLSISDGTLDSTLKSCECTLLETANLSEVIKLLRGNGKITFSNEPDYEYEAIIINKIPFEQIIPNLYKFIIQFECQPLKLLVNQDLITLTTPTTIYNQGTYVSQPELKIYGLGNVSITINNQTFNINNLTDYITIDSELEKCYKDTQPLDNQMVGGFPILKTGENVISWTGSIAKIELQPRWRCL